MLWIRCGRHLLGHDHRRDLLLAWVMAWYGIDMEPSYRVKFNGQKYYWYGRYYGATTRKGPDLHRAVWIFHNGPIPSGHHIHHVDHDATNNDISNLECISSSEHTRRHQKNLPYLQRNCIQCNGEYKTKSVKSRYCSNNCKSAYRRKSGADNIRAICHVCHELFSKNRYALTKTCGSRCGGILSGGRRRGS